MKAEMVKEMASSLGADVCGIASIDRFTEAPKGFHPNDIMPNAKSVVVFGKQSSKTLFEARSNVPYTLVRNKLAEHLDNIAMTLIAKVEESGNGAIPIPSVEPYEYWDTECRHGRGILSLKHAAQLAGLGRLGKNTLLINKKFGNRLWLGAILTSSAIEPDPISSFEGCKSSCSICLDACPQKALDGITVNQKRCREIVYTSTEGGGGIYACNVCRKMCPFAKV